ncbi:hypothetical protein [Pseudoneobacillus sp. C159]
MTKDLLDMEYSFKEWHDNYLSKWNDAMMTGDTAGVEQMDPGYYVTFFTNKESKPTYYTYDEAIDGMRQSVNALIGTEKRFENRIIRMKNNENAIVFYEQVLVKEGKDLSRLFTTEEWQIKSDGWVMVREVDLVVR